MADEPNKHMDEILRAYTEARRKGAELPLHPATRKMLHAEVARRFKAPSMTRPFWARLRTIWPQLAFGSGLCAILLVAVLSLRQRPPEPEPALGGSVQPKKSVESARRGAQQNESRSAPAGASDALLKRDELKLKTEPGAQLDAPAPTVPQLQTAKKEREQLARANQPVSQRSEPREVELQTRPAVPVTPLSASKDKTVTYSGTTLQTAESKRASVAVNPARINDLTNLGDAVRLRFVELPGARQAASPQVLSSFQIEQQGDDLRFMDKDGSIYLGEVIATPPAPPVQPIDARSYNPVNRALQLAETTQNTATYFFRAAGTNLTLSKPVTIEGRFLQRTNLAALAGRSKDPSAKPPELVQMLGRARHVILGKATVARTNEFPVNAISIEPGN